MWPGLSDSGEGAEGTLQAHRGPLHAPPSPRSNPCLGQFCALTERVLKILAPFFSHGLQVLGTASVQGHCEATARMASSFVAEASHLPGASLSYRHTSPRRLVSSVRSTSLDISVQGRSQHPVNAPPATPTTHTHTHTLCAIT